MQRTEKKYKRLEQALNKIMQARINDGWRAGGKPKARPQALIGDMEKAIGDIVAFHQRGETAAHLPFLFDAALMMNVSGAFHLLPEQSDVRTYNAWQGCRSRLEVIITAALNALPDPGLIDLFHDKRAEFDRYRGLAEHAWDIAEAAAMIRRRAEAAAKPTLKTEAHAIADLQELSVWRAQAREIEAQYVTMKNEPHIEESVRRLRHALTLAWKGIEAKSRKSSAYILNQAHQVFQDFKATKPEPANSQALMRQQAVLAEYCRLFDSAGDERRRSLLQNNLTVIENTLARLNQTIAAEKKRDSARCEKNANQAEAAYQRFIEIQQAYHEGKLDTPERVQAVLPELKKCVLMLKAHGRRVKALDIERFINAAGLGAPDASLEHVRAGYQFYKRAFFLLLVVVLSGLAVALYYTR